MTDHEQLLKDSHQFVGDLVAQLSNTYELLMEQGIETDELGYALDALIYANSKLEGQQEKIASRKAERIAEFRRDN